MRCPNCQFDNPDTAKFCAECGGNLRTVCPQCGSEVGPNVKFCSECGAQLAGGTRSKGRNLERQFAEMREAMPSTVRERLMAPVDGENRLVTVLFADMSSSVATTGKMEPEDAVELVNKLLRAMVDVFSRYEGRIDRFLGDGALAVFGTPHAHENDPERAILAAMEIRDDALELGLNITAGINTGQVYFGTVGAAEHRELTVMGQVVNLAARFQGKADAGEIIVGESTYRHVRRSFDVTPLSLEIKGIEGIVAGYRIESQRMHFEKVRGLDGLKAELIGRDDEFARLKDSLAEAIGGTGQIVSIIGEAGVGKSRLVSELRGVVRPEGDGQPDPLWLEGRCLELGMTATYWPFIDMLREYFGFSSEDEEAARAVRVVSTLNELQQGGALSEVRVREVGPLLGRLLSVRFGTEWDSALTGADPELIKNQTFVAIRDLLLASAKQRPVILVFDDLHWSDSTSIDVISLLMESLTLAPLFLICVYRPEREQKCWQLGTIAPRKCPERFTEFVLKELTPAESRMLIHSLLAIDGLSESVRSSILEKSQGNPFFVEEVIRSLIDSGIVYQEGERWVARKDVDDHAVVPQSIQSVILSRIDRLEERLKHVLQSAAVIGRIFRRRVLENTAEDERELEQKLLQLEDRAFIYQERAIPEEEYSFKHVLTQETVYQSILRRLRAEFHGKVVSALESLYEGSLEEFYEQLAYHCERAGDAGKAVGYLRRAGEKALANYANEDAASRFERALELVDGGRDDAADDATRVELLFGLVRAQSGVFDAPDERLLHPLREAFDKFVAAGNISRAAAVAEYPFFIGSVVTGAAQIGRRALDLVAPGSLEAGRILSQYASNVYRETADYEAARELFDRAMAIAQDKRDTALEMRTLAHLGDVALRALDWETCLESGRRAVELAKIARDFRTEVRAGINVVMVAMALGNLEIARVHASEMLQPAEKLRNTFYMLLANDMNLAVCLWEGRWEEGRAYGERGLALSPVFTMILVDWAVLEHQVGNCKQGTELMERA